MIENGKERFEKVIEKFKELTKKECMAFSLVDKEPGLLDSKLGGIPYMPVGENVPKDSKGNDMGLVLQINLKDIDLEGWPKEGIIECFWSDLFSTWPNESKVIYFKDTSKEARTDLTWDSSNVSDMFEKPYTLSFNKSIEYMPLSDFRFVRTLTSLLQEEFKKEIKSATYINNPKRMNYGDMSDFLEKEFDFGTCVDKKGRKKTMDWYDFIPSPNNMLTIGGYADFTQDDIRYDEKSDATECLFKIDSCYDFKKIDLGDAGIMVGVISPEALLNCEFEKAEMSWDCG